MFNTKILSIIYPSLTWNKPRTDKVLYLSFDDGPIPEVTPWVLNKLSEHKAKATFFCIGDNIDKHPEIFEAVKAAGHALGNHTQNHLNGWKKNNIDYFQNIIDCQSKTQTKLFRPPFGRISTAQIKQLKQEYRIIMWSILSRDYDPSLSPEKCSNNVIKHAKSGDIIVFHDSIKAFPRMKVALNKTLEHFSALGYRFEKLEEH